MHDHPTLHVGDEYLCVRWGHWHPLYLKYPHSGTFDEGRRLFFDCGSGDDHTFYVGRTGERVSNLARWRRPAH